MPIDNSAAQTAQSALQAIPFGTLIGGPLDACIQAQAKAAQTSWEFIDKVGLWTDPTTKEKKAVNVNFQYNKNGQMVNLVVPLLTIVPIPFLAINKVLIDFKANISASSSTASSTSTSEDLSAGGSAKGKIGWGPFSVSFEAHANYSSKKDSKASQESKYSVEYTMDIHVEGGQADMPAGLAAILNILQSAVTDAPVGGSVTVSPQQSTLQALPGAQLYLETTVKNSLGVLQSGAKVNFKLENISAGMTFKTIKVITGALESATTTSAVVVTNEKGIAGITLEVDSINYTQYTAQIMDMNVSTSIKNPDDPNEGNKELKTTGKIKGTTALPPTNTIEADPESIPNLTTTGTVTVSLTDSSGNPLKQKTVNAISTNTDKCTVTASATTNDSGNASFTVTKVTGATAGSADVKFTGEGASVVVSVTIA